MDLDSRPVVQILVSHKRTETQKVVILGISQPTKPHFPIKKHGQPLESPHFTIFYTMFFFFLFLVNIFILCSNTWNYISFYHKQPFLYLFIKVQISFWSIQYTYTFYCILFSELSRAHIIELCSHFPVFLFPLKWVKKKWPPIQLFSHTFQSLSTHVVKTLFFSDQLWILLFCFLL